jgi:hypothetical protein
MTLPQLQSRLVRLGIILSALEDELVVDAPVGVLTPDLKAALVTHKAALLGQLTGVVPRSAPSAGAGWRQRVACWPVEWRQRWADRAEACQAAGTAWDAAEWRAFQETIEEINGADARGELIALAGPSESISDIDAADAIARIVWDGSSLAESIGEGRKHSVRILNGRRQTKRIKSDALSG